LLDALIAQRRQEALDYRAYLERIVELARRVAEPENQAEYPTEINNAALRALYDNLEGVGAQVVRERPDPYRPDANEDPREALALSIDRAIRDVKKADWRGNRFKEREVRNAIQNVIGADRGLVDALFEIVKNQREY
jgi:type I restriction enzyme R subunit